jgi:lipopolysaccharide export system protein LptC
MSLRIDAAHRVPRGRTARVAARARIAPYVSGAFAGVIVILLAVFLYQTGAFSPAPKRVDQTAASLDQVTVTDSTITGLDRQNRPYSISASNAVQDKDKPNFIALEEVSGATKRSDGEAITFESRKGFYDSDVKTLDLDTDVVIKSAGRFTARMEKAHVMVAEKRLTSNVPVTVEFTSGTIDANGVEISNDGNNILFLNGVKAQFRDTKTGDSTHEPSCQPRPNVCACRPRSLSAPRYGADRRHRRSRQECKDAQECRHRSRHDGNSRRAEEGRFQGQCQCRARRCDAQMRHAGRELHRNGDCSRRED